MKRIGILYATREGQTRRIARYAADYFGAQGYDIEVFNLDHATPDLANNPYTAVILAGSVHAGRHERELVRFVRDNRAALDRVPAAFLSVSLSEAGAERTDATPEEHAAFSAGVQEMLDTFYRETGWHPSHVKPVAGALRYTHYNFVVRFILKRIARKAGGSTDTRRDHEYTDWDALDRFLSSFEESLRAAGPAAAA